MASRLGEGHMPCTFFLSEPQLKTTVNLLRLLQDLPCFYLGEKFDFQNDVGKESLNGVACLLKV